MDVLAAEWTAHHLQTLVGTLGPRARAACFPIPLRPGHLRRGTPWTFLLVTDQRPDRVRETLPGLALEFVQRRGRDLVLIAWPRDDCADLTL